MRSDGEIERDVKEQLKWNPTSTPATPAAGSLCGAGQSRFSASARVLKVPRLRRFPVFGLIFREYRR